MLFRVGVQYGIIQHPRLQLIWDLLYRQQFGSGFCEI